MAAKSKSKSSRKTAGKKAAARTGSTAAKGRTAKKAAKGKAGKPARVSKKPAAKQAAGKKSTAVRSTAGKSATGKSATGKSATGKSAGEAGKTRKANAKTPEEMEEVTLELDDLIEVDDLVDDPPAPETAAQRSRRGPRTPTVPRSVKPPPKHADLEMSDDVLEFVEAIDHYRQVHCRPFPTWTEVFHVLRELGYEKAR